MVIHRILFIIRISINDDDFQILLSNRSATSSRSDFTRKVKKEKKTSRCGLKLRLMNIKTYTISIS